MQAKQLYHEQIMTTSVGPNHASSTAWVRLIAAPTVEASGKFKDVDKLYIDRIISMMIKIRNIRIQRHPQGH